MQKKIFVKDLKAGDTINDIFAVMSKTLAQKRNGENYLSIAVGDKTGSVKGVAWDDVENIYNTFSSFNYVYISGYISKYKEEYQLIVKKAKGVLPENIICSDFLPAVDANVDKLFSRLMDVIKSIKKMHMKQLLDLFFDDKDFIEKFKKAPAAKKMHHAYLGGLLEHSLSVALLAEKIAGHYKDIDMDLLKTGAILHDIGKTEEFEYKYVIDYSDAGRLLNHIPIGISMVKEKIAAIEDFPAKDSMLLLHLIASHHGIREFGSPEPPKTIEAVLLNHMDEIDSKVIGIRAFIQKDKSESTWTRYHRLYERHFYKA